MSVHVNKARHQISARQIEDSSAQRGAIGFCGGNGFDLAGLDLTTRSVRMVPLWPGLGLDPAAESFLSASTSDILMSRNILVFAGSTRANSLNRKLAVEAAELLRAAGSNVTFADLRDYPMPLYDGDLEETGGLPPSAKALKELARAHDVFVIASPEYNGSFPAVLKNAIDWLSRPEPGEPHLAVFRGKVAAIMSASPGPGGGRRGLKHLRELLEMIGVTVVPTEVAVARSSQAFGEDGKLVRPEDVREMAHLAEDLLLARAA